jgi:hypothetical protein
VSSKATGADSGRPAAGQLASPPPTPVGPLPRLSGIPGCTHLDDVLRFFRFAEPLIAAAAASPVSVR